MITCGLAGLFVAVANLALIATGEGPLRQHQIGRSMALVAFSLMLVVAAFEARSETETAFDTDIFNSSRMNLIAVAEIAGAFLITQADFLQRLLGTAQLTATQWGLALLAAVVLLLGWEAGNGSRAEGRQPTHSRPHDSWMSRQSGLARRNRWDITDHRTHRR